MLRENVNLNNLAAANTFRKQVYSLRVELPELDCLVPLQDLCTVRAEHLFIKGKIGCPIQRI